MQKLVLLSISLFLFNFSCKKELTKPAIQAPADTTTQAKSDVLMYLTHGDQTALLQKRLDILRFATQENSYPTIEIDSSKQYQSVDGFGFMLTSGSAELINKMEAKAKASLLKELFEKGPDDISISYLRIAIGASDLSAQVYTYNDLPSGKTDTNMESFSLEPDKKDVIPLLKELLKINKDLKIMATPWTAPIWMKDNQSWIGGCLKTEYHDAYARYFVKYLEAMQAEGIHVEAVTIQNEPLNPKNNPSMYMAANQQAIFVKNHLGPAFKKAGINTKIVIYDHNCDEPGYPLEILADKEASAFVDGSAFHLYGGNISAMGAVHQAHPDKSVYFTEQYTSSKGEFGGDLRWHLRNVVIGALRNWSRTVLEWNLANDPNFGPYTPGGCTECRGALTINGNSISRNVSYYIVAHASKFVPPGSVRIESNNSGSLHSVAFLCPDSKKVLIVLNDGAQAQTFNVKYKGKWYSTSLAAGSVASYLW